MSGLGARFDDLTAGGVATEFGAPARTLEAVHPDEVVPLLQAVEEAAAGGWWAVGFLTYEAASGLDSNLRTRPATVDDSLSELPLAWFGLFASPRAVEPLRLTARGDREYQVSPWQPAVDAASYQGKVARVREQIEAGDTYQCNLSLPLRSRIGGNLFDLYRDLALAQCGAYNAYLDTGRYVVASASPELFFEWTGDRLTTKPMKGTVARGRWPEEDAVRARELVGSGKERAENVMIVDLLRNDLGKVAEAGSVDVLDLFFAERFGTLWQLTSTVTARVDPKYGLPDVFRALFPCGSVTGAPKARTMELIAELEESRRGVYCGAVGVVAPPGAEFRARFNVAIRTVVVDRRSGDAVYGAGGGITWDSTPIGEHDEVLAKTAILRATPAEFQLLETMAFQPGAEVQNLELHLVRLAASADYFDFHADLEQIRSSIHEALRGIRVATRVRLLLERCGLISIERLPMPPSPIGPVRLEVDLEPVDSSDIWLYHKTTRREVYRCRAARHPACDDVIMINDRGEITETTVANLVVELDGCWFTPPLDAGCLPGVQRRLLLAQGQIIERVITVDDLSRVQGVALINSLRGWRTATIESLPSVPAESRPAQRSTY
jgi:para-aminobenzoate synthetase/4-amino-4-deoxychorismate lyase